MEKVSLKQVTQPGDWCDAPAGPTPIRPDN